MTFFLKRQRGKELKDVLSFGMGEGKCRDLMIFHYKSSTLRSSKNAADLNHKREYFPNFYSSLPKLGTERTSGHRINMESYKHRIFIPKFHRSKFSCKHPVKDYDFVFECILVLYKISTNRFMPNKIISVDKQPQNLSMSKLFFIAQNEMAEKAGSVWTKEKRCSERQNHLYRLARD